jgi:GNAT superfamily N-acetyltransferase
MTRRFAFHVEEKPAEADRHDIHMRLRGSNVKLVGRPFDLRPFSVFIRDGDGAIVGGLNGSTMWDCLAVDQIWIDEGLRRRGWGRRLMQAAERIAMRRGCRSAFVDTFSFQSPGFYERMGYVECGRMSHHADVTWHFFTKTLAPKPKRQKRKPARRK